MYRHVCAILDTETTGLGPKRGDRIVEVAAVKIRDGDVKKEDYFSSLVNPQRSIPPAASRVNRIYDDMVHDAPVFKDIIEDLLQFLSGVDYLFIHNAKFDIGFLEAEMERINKPLKLPKIVCSVDLSRMLYPQFQRHNLNALAKNFGLSISQGENRHRALGDVILTGEAILKIYEENALTFLGTLEQLSNSKYT
jgi:DNA polymerase III subunit epsilon